MPPKPYTACRDSSNSKQVAWDRGGLSPKALRPVSCQAPNGTLPLSPSLDAHTDPLKVYDYIKLGSEEGSGVFTVTELRDGSVIRTQPCCEPSFQALPLCGSGILLREEELPGNPAGQAAHSRQAGSPWLPRAHHRSGTPHFKVIHRAGLVWLGLRPWAVYCLSQDSSCP